MSLQRGIDQRNALPLGRILSMAAVVALLGGAAIWPQFASGRAEQEAQLRPVSPRGDLTAEERTNIDVFKTASPSVVHITTLQSATNFFSFDVQQVPRGTGTGMVWDKEGDIVTNYHVIEDADAARVTLADQTTYKASLVGAFPDRDLAVLRIKAPAEKLKPVLIGQSSNLQVGQKVYAIGNPFGLDQTLTTGIISALGREIESVTRHPIHGVIQTDAAINPGNSGGPLLDSAARLIGVNTMIYSPSGASAGIGFAIPVDEVNRVVARLIHDGRYIRASVGISAAPASLNQALHLPEGVAVIGLTPKGPAAVAGVHPFKRDNYGEIIVGDIITAVNGKAVTTYDNLLDLLDGYHPGDKVSLRIWRDKGFVIVPVTLADEGQ